MKRFLALVGVVAIASLAAVQIYYNDACLVAAQVFYSENVTAGASGAAVPTLSNWASARAVRVTMLTADAGLYVRFFRDLLVNGDFEDVQRVETTPATAVPDPITEGFPDAWDDSDNLLTWGWTEGTVTVEEETTNEIYGRSSLRFESSAVTQMLLNEDLEAVAADNFTNWVENVNAGTGTITSEETDIYDGAESAELTGGTAHVDFTSDTTVVVASTAYVLSVWGDIAAAGDLLDIRVREATGGTDFLQADGTWAAGEIDFCNAVFDDAAAATFTHCVIEFTTDVGITGITVSANVDVAADVGRVDAFSLHAKDNTIRINAVSRVTINDTVADSYVCAFTQDAAAASSARAEYAIVNYGTDAPLVPRYYTGTAWSATETWISSAYAATATQQRAYFEADTSDGHYFEFRIRPETMGDNEDLYIDKAFCTATARAGVGVLLAGVGSWFEFNIVNPGRFTVMGASATVVNFTALE